MSKLYDFSQYDKHLSLKLNSELWLIIFYLMRPYIVLVASLRPSRQDAGAVGVDGVRNMLYPDDFSLVLAILATLPVLFFIYAWSRRKPGAGSLVRALWKNGATLLAMSAALNILIVFVPILLGVVAGIHTLGWLQVGFAVAIIAYLYSSRRVRDTFQDFPVERE